MAFLTVLKKHHYGTQYFEKSANILKIFSRKDLKKFNVYWESFIFQSVIFHF